MADNDHRSGFSWTKWKERVDETIWTGDPQGKNGGLVSRMIMVEDFIRRANKLGGWILGMLGLILSALIVQLITSHHL